MAKNIKKLELSKDDKMLSGVCGGLAQYFGIDSTLVRIAWIFGTLFSGIFPGVIAYVACAIVMSQKA